MEKGVKTTEFWLTFVSIIGSLLVASGVVAPQDQEIIVELGRQIVLGLLAAVSMGTYIISRTDLKREVIRKSVPEVTPDLPSGNLG